VNPQAMTGCGEQGIIAAMQKTYYFQKQDERDN
jgi:hypothetical protein